MENTAAVWHCCAMDGSCQLRKSDMDVSTQEIWDSIQAAASKGGNVIGVISGTVKGGFSVDITGIPMFIPDMPADVCKYLLGSTGIRAFLPGSLADVRPVPLKDDSLLIGKELELRVIKAERQRNFNVVVSCKAAKKKAMSERRDLLLANLQEGQVVMGTVKTLTDYCAFIDLGGIDGLLHMKDMSWKRVSNPSEVVSVGDEIKVRVLKFDHERKRITLGLKQLEADPREIQSERGHAADRISFESLAEGQVLKGTVKNIKSYGAFVDLGGIDGLLHITDMSWKRVNNPKDIVSIGEEIEVKVLKLDQEHKKVSLGLKQLGADPWTVLAERCHVGDRIKGKVTNIKDYGCFVEVEDGIEGLVHRSEMDWTNQNVNPASLVSKGDNIEVQVLSIDLEKRRISLGLKQCRPNPWEAFAAAHKKGDRVTGRVKSVSKFGIFVVLDVGITGLVHLCDISSTVPGDDAAGRYHEGDEVQAVVLNVQPDEERISLGIKQLEDAPAGN